MNRSSESGNALWFLLLAIILIGALTLAVTGSTDSTEQSGDVEHQRVRASDAMRFAKGVEQAVTRMRMRGISENVISFYTGDLTDHDNTNCTDNSCLVFHPAGGGVAYKAPGPINDGSAWIITGANNIDGVGTTAADLVMILPNIDPGACAQINRMLGVTPSGATNDIVFSPYLGSFETSPTVITGMTGTKAGCHDSDDEDYGLFFYQVLIER